MDEFYLLYDFAPFMSVAMAINYVSSFWDGVKNNAINKLNSHIDNSITELNAVYTSGNCRQSEPIAELENEANGYKSTLEIMSLLATVFGIIVVIILFILLALIGYSPKKELTFAQANFIVIISIIPSNLMMLIGMIYADHSIKKLAKTRNTIKMTARAAIRDNEQAAYTTNLSGL